MAENPPPNAGAPAAVDAVADAAAKLHLDEVTGEMISKSELKKRQKNRQKEAEKKQKAEKLAASGAPAPKPKSTEDSEKDLTPNQVLLPIRIQEGREWKTDICGSTSRSDPVPSMLCTPRARHTLTRFVVLLSQIHSG